MTLRNKIGSTALANVQSYLARYTPGETEDYVRSALIYYGEIPFLYRVFDPTNVHSSKEKGGYKVVSTLFLIDVPPPTFSQIRHGIFQHLVIVDTVEQDVIYQCSLYMYSVANTITRRAGLSLTLSG